MSKQVFDQAKFSGGIADYSREGIQDSFMFARSIDVRSDPRSFKLLPRTVKESGSVITDLPKWAVQAGSDSYFYGDTGNFYKRTTGATFTNLRTVTNSHGNGMDYFQEDDFLYYTSDSVIGRYGPISGTPQFTDDYFASLGGVPLNTNSLDLEASSSQYASRADTATLSITGDITLEAQIKPESMPAVGSTQTLISKWDESGALRSYRFDVAAVSGYFGDGSDGALVISSNTTEAPIDSACTGTIATTSLSATNASFAAGQLVLIHQTQGTGAGTWERNQIASYTAGTITLTTALASNYVSGAQVRTLPQYTNVTINSGITYTAKAWNGTVGGILAFVANGTVTVTGTISAAGATGGQITALSTIGGRVNGGGFRGGNARKAVFDGTTGAQQGESPTGDGGYSTAVNGAAGGGGLCSGSGYGGGGSAHATAGTNGSGAGSDYGRGSSNTYDTTDLTTMTLGTGGGGGGNDNNSTSETAGAGGNGGGIVFITGATLTVTGSVTSNGGSGGASNEFAAGGGGTGGSILIKTQNATLGTALITASGATAVGAGGAGGVGRIHIDYLTSYTGTTSPTIDATQDNSLVTNTTYQLRLSVSSTGLNSEILSKNTNLQAALWQQVAVTWDASASTAEFFLNSVSIGTASGALTAIHNNASTFQVGMHKDGAGAATSFYDGLIDEVRVWSVLKTADDLYSWSASQTLVNLAGLNAYYKFNGDYSDATANANDLTSSGSPVFVTDVPFPSPTTRLDIDQSAVTAGNTYTPPTSISESATNRKTFTPEKDPQKGLTVLVASVGTGNWTVTVHDEQNNTVATKTIANASMSTGYLEFTFTNVWRPLFNQPYHFHVTSTVADGTVTTGTASDLETVSYKTYYQFLVTDTEFHPVSKMLEMLVIGNERYIATYSATLYEPNQITLPAGYRIRCFGYWNEYLAIGVVKGDSVYAVDGGRVYFWDGTADTYNFYIDVPEGAINAVLGTKGELYIWAGYQGDMLVYRGGATAEKVQRIPKIVSNKYVEIYPGAVTMWQSLIRFGVAGGSDSTDIQKGGYTYGSLNIRYPQILTYDYPISTGTLTGNNLKIGMMTTINRKLFIGWQDGTAYGVDYVDAGNLPYLTGSIELLIRDDGAVWHEKTTARFIATFLPLLTGEGVDIGFKINGDSTYTMNGVVTEVGQMFNNFEVGERYQEYQTIVNLSSTGSTSPTVLSVALERDLLESEKRTGGTK